jgi:tRNA(Arg) A34 adenosine deaminase TadA
MTAEEYMHIALNLAHQASAEDEVPVGALIVDPTTGEIIASAFNQSAHNGDSTCHAEIIAIREACKKCRTNRLRNLEMYVTLEPCTMCAAAISFARISKLYFGATDEKGGAVISGVRFYTAPTCHHKPEVISGICADECSQILKDFFRAKRK